MPFTPLLRLCALVFVAATSLRADVVLASIFKDHAVLQREEPVPVWGRADPGEKVRVEFLDQTQTTTADASGNWSVTLTPLVASATPAALSVSGKNTLRLIDILVGEVWLASGQSNMEFPVYLPGSIPFQLDNARAEVAGANYPLIREIHVDHVVADKPAETFSGAWTVCSPETVGNFSAVAYFFARDLFHELHVPIGIIHSSWGGTPVESWMSASVLSSRPEFSVVAQRWAQGLAEYPAKKAMFDAAMADWEKDAAEARKVSQAARDEFSRIHRRPRAPRGPGDSWTPAGLFNGMIAPLVPAAFRGVIWYQGESNAERAGEYRGLFSAMITQWRQSFGREFPFYFVQLANYNAGDRAGTDYAFLREAQTQTLEVPDTGMAVTIDIGTPGNIHPGNKQDVGHRLALIAAARTYGRLIEYTGPVFRSMVPEGSLLRVTFDHAAQLSTRGGPPAGFAIAGADKVFHPADVRIEQESVLISSPDVPDPIAVRYDWANAPMGNLINGSGLPARPFRSDAW